MSRQIEGSVIPRRMGAISRRAFAGLATALGVALVGAPAQALADLTDTEAKLKDAQARYDAVQEQLEGIYAEYEALSAEQSDTLSRIEVKQTEIDQTQIGIDTTQDQISEAQRDIARKEVELEEDQEILGKRVASAYKAGNSGLLEILLSSSSFEELVSNIYYLDKISASDRAMIDAVKAVKAELDERRLQLEEHKAALEEQKTSLEGQRAELEELNEQQKAQLKDMMAKQKEVQEVLSGLDAEVSELMAKRDEELLAAQRAAAAAEEARRRAEQEASGNASNIPTGGGQDSSSATGAARAVVNACYSTPSPGLGWCAAWCTNVFVNAGIGFFGGDACDMYANWCYSSDKSALKVGMIVAVSTHSHTSAGRIYGHIGIYIGDGMMMDNVGYIRTISVDEWISFYSTTVSTRWGWLGGVVLS